MRRQYPGQVNDIAPKKRGRGWLGHVTWHGEWQLVMDAETDTLCTYHGTRQAE
jgi:hypothetical protein